MQENSRIHFIPAVPKREKRVAVYARVSTNDAEQLKSLAAQVSAFTRLVASTPQWLLVDVYMDTANTDSDLMISIIESLAQAENESRSDNIKWGIKQRAANGSSKLYD